jgi:hypothetical protein
MFMTFDNDLKAMQAPVVITPRMSSGVYPTIVFNESEYIIAWHDADEDPRTVYGAVRDELGSEVVPATPLIKTTGQARYPSVLPYGDRALLVWSDNRDNNMGYELYAKTLTNHLAAKGPEIRLTNARGNSIDGTTSFGPNGEVGILFSDERTGATQVYFTHLECVAGNGTH